MTAKNYISVLTVFYQYIYAEFGWKNKLFENKNENAELREAYENKIKELKLNTKEQVQPLIEKEAERLVNACNKKLEIKDDLEIVNGYGIIMEFLQIISHRLFVK